jgi:hypothetical protein
MLRTLALLRSHLNTSVRTKRSERLLAGIVFQAADQNADPSNRLFEYGLGDPCKLGGVVNVDDGRTMLGGSPTAELAVNNLEDLETEKDPVIDVGSEHKVQLCFDGELLDFGWAK